MIRRPALRLTVIALAIAAVAALVRLTEARALPARLSDADFWALVNRLSEPQGKFPSDNLVSDEMIFSEVMPAVAARSKSGGVYLGVGPEQNFSYLASLESPMAFIIDIRRGNLHLQLLYKALFELSNDRADFISRLFIKPRPAGLAAGSTASDLIKAYWNTATHQAAFDKRLAEVDDLLTKTHHLPLSADDLEGIRYVYHAFFWFGPSITWSSSSGPRRGGPNFGDLVMQKDRNGAETSFLATESRFAFVKALQQKNLIVPVVGDFGGPSALRAVGAYVRSQGATVDAFYVSEVEAYLLNEKKWLNFCQNLTALPIDNRSVLIRPSLMSFGEPAPATVQTQSLVEAFHDKLAKLVPIQGELTCAAR